MKFHSVLFTAALCAITVFTSCKNDSDASKNATAETTGTQPATGTTDVAAAPFADPAIAPAPAPATTPAPAPAPTEPPQNAAGVWHYTCPKGCAGGAGAAAACAKCGTMLTHNTVYHGQPKATTTSANPAIAPGATAATPTPKPPEPAQNAAGVWHYTCSAGCAGGGGAAGACAKCSKPLAHNQAYHQ